MRARLPRHLLRPPPRSRTGRQLHRAMDAAGDAALSRDRDPPPPAPAPLPLATLVERTGRSGRPVLVGSLNGWRLVAAAADELDHRGHRVWHLHLMPAPAPASAVAAMPARLR